MPKWIKLGLGVLGVCAACCALPLAAALLGGSALWGALTWAEGLRWWLELPLLVVAVAGVGWGVRRLARTKPCDPATVGLGARCPTQKTGCACSTSP